MPSSFPCSPVIRECSWKETQIEKKSDNIKMMHYSVQPSDRIFVKDYGFLSFAKTIGKNIGKNTSEILLSGG